MIIYFFLWSLVYLELLPLDLSVHLPALAQLQKSQCSTSALARFVSECNEKGAEVVSVEERLAAAVDLSVCEFEAALVEYPAKCRNMKTATEYLDCVLKLRPVAQFWTTYSGNYQKLKSICHEEAPFIARQLLVDLVFNLTRLYGDLQRKATEATYEYDCRLIEMQQNINFLADTIEQLTTAYKTEKAEQSSTHFQAMAVLKSEAAHINDDLEVILEKNKAFIDSVSVSFERFQQQILDDSRQVFEELDSYQTDAFSGIKLLNRDIEHLLHQTSESEALNLRVHAILDQNFNSAAALYDDLSHSHNELGNQVEDIRETLDYAIAQSVERIDRASTDASRDLVLRFHTITELLANLTFGIQESLEKTLDIGDRVQREMSYFGNSGILSMPALVARIAMTVKIVIGCGVLVTVHKCIKISGIWDSGENSSLFCFINATVGGFFLALVVRLTLVYLL